MRTLAQPVDGGKEGSRKTRSHLDRGLTTSFERLGHVLAAGRGSMSGPVQAVVAVCSGLAARRPAAGACENHHLFTHLLTIF